MRIKGAMTILNKRADFYGKTFDELIKFIDDETGLNETFDAIDNGMDENMTVTQAYEVYKIDQGYIWCGVGDLGFTTPEKASDAWKIWRGEGVQMEMKI